MSLLLTLNIFHTPCSSVFVVNFEHVIVRWVDSERNLYLANAFSLGSIQHMWQIPTLIMAMKVNNISKIDCQHLVPIFTFLTEHLHFVRT